MKLRLVAILSLFVLTSCLKDVLPESGNAAGHGRIAFVLDGIGTRSTVTSATLESLQTNGFKVAGVLDADGSVYFNENASWDSGSSVFNTETSHYFPYTGTLSFFALYPRTRAITITSGVATADITADGLTDVVAAKSTGRSSQSTALAFAFDHILSQVNVSVKGADAALTYKVKKVSFQGNNSGTYNFSSDSWTSFGGNLDCTFFSGTKTLSETDTLFTEGSPSVNTTAVLLPGVTTLTMEWEVYKGLYKIGDFQGENAASAEVTLIKGRNTTICVTLPKLDENYLQIDPSIKDWVTETIEIRIPSR